MTNLENNLAKVFLQLTDENIQYRICEKMGWIPKEIYIDNTKKNEIVWTHPTSGHWVSRIPNWVENISDAYELEEGIPEDDRGFYIYYLALILGNDIAIVNDWYLIHATPRQRCLAWLMWKEWE
jgi:hypothetical protein